MFERFVIFYLDQLLIEKSVYPIKMPPHIFIRNAFMSQNEEFKDSTSTGLVSLVIAAIFAFPLLPMLMGWFTMLR